MSALAAVLYPGVTLALVLGRAFWPPAVPPSARAERLRRNP